MNQLTSSLAVAVVLAPGFARAATYEIDPAHTSAQFTVRHMMVSNVRGELGKVTGTLKLDDKDVRKSTVEATVDVASISTREPKRDEHLKSAEFFDVAKFPTVTFKSTRVEPLAAGKLKVTGNLTMHGVTREVVLDVEGPTPEVKDPWGNVKVGYTATTKLNRKDFGLTWNKSPDAGGVVLGDDVPVTIDLELQKKAPAVAG